MGKFKITYEEQCIQSVVVDLPEDDPDEAWKNLTEMDGSDLIGVLDLGNQKEIAVIERNLTDIKPWEEKDDEG